MAFTTAQAQAYYKTLNAEQQAAVDQSGGPSVAWLTNAVNAGVPDAIRAAGGRATNSGYEEGAEGGMRIDDPNAKPSSEWLGKRKPTPSELRAYGREQHARYVGGDRSAQDEDYERYSDRLLAEHIRKYWNPSRGTFVVGGKATSQPWLTADGNSRGGRNRAGANRRGARQNPALARQTNFQNTPAATPAPATPNAPEFVYEEFKPPTYEEAMADPGYQFALKEGQDALQNTAAARGTLRTGGTLQDLVDYNQGMASQQYGNAWNRAAQEYGVNQANARQMFDPKMQEWQTKYAGDLSRWTTGTGQDLSRWQTKYGGNLARWQTQYGGNLSRDLQREQNIYGLLNAPPPAYPGGY